MNQLDKITVEATISRSPFSGERIFTIRLADGTEHVGTASPEYCFTRDGKGIRADQPADGTDLDGRIMARFIRPEGKNACLVSLPDGSVAAVPTSRIRVLKEVPPDVPVEP